MHINQLLSLVALLSVVRATTYDVILGGSSLAFDPDHVKAAPGDLVNFHFASAPASVAQSSFQAPCRPSQNGIWSGQVVVASPSVGISQDWGFQDTRIDAAIVIGYDLPDQLDRHQSHLALQCCGFLLQLWYGHGHQSAVSHLALRVLFHIFHILRPMIDDVS